MKLACCTERNGGRDFLGVVLGDSFLDVQAVLEDAGRSETIPSDMAAYLRSGSAGPIAVLKALDFLSRDADGQPRSPLGRNGRKVVYSLSEIVLRPAVPKPGKIIHTAVNFGSHLGELAKWQAPEWQAHGWENFHYEHPTGFLQAPSSVLGHEGIVNIPRFTRQLDYEIELAIVIGKAAKYVTQADALNYVAGFCIFNDISARDIQAREHANKVVMLGKSFDGSCPLGPWLVTPDELDDPQKLRMELKLNGEVRQSASTADMNYKIRDLVSWWSNTTLEPGDVITSGSPAGVIAGMKEPAWMKPGDRIDATIEGLGTLTTFIGAEPDMKRNAIFA